MRNILICVRVCVCVIFIALWPVRCCSNSGELNEKKKRFHILLWGPSSWDDFYFFYVFALNRQNQIWKSDANRCALHHHSPTYTTIYYFHERSRRGFLLNFFKAGVGQFNNSISTTSFREELPIDCSLKMIAIKSLLACTCAAHCGYSRGEKVQNTLAAKKRLENEHRNIQVERRMKVSDNKRACCYFGELSRSYHNENWLSHRISHSVFLLFTSSFSFASF